MWESAAYSQNIFKVMLDPLTWSFAAIAVFALKRWSLWQRIAIALAANALFMFVWRWLPHGPSGRIYGWIAIGYELAATAVWPGIFAGCRRLFVGAPSSR